MRISDWSSDVCSSDLKRYIDPYIAVANFGVCGNAISGLAAHRLGLPGTALPDADRGDTSRIGVVSFPGGNTTILRMMLARMIPGVIAGRGSLVRSEEHTSELQSLMRTSYAVFCLKKKTTNKHRKRHRTCTTYPISSHTK